MSAGGILVRNARVRGSGGGRPPAAAFFARDGVFVVVGDEAEAGAAARAAGRAGVVVAELDAAGRTVTPGLIDAHTHVVLAADRSLELSLVDAADRADALRRVAAAHAALPEGTWLLGAGQRDAAWQEPADRAALDRVVGDRPVFLASYDAHGAWVSSAALAIAGVGRDTADPPGGRVGRDATGEPDGRLFENAVALVRRAVPPPDPSRRAEAVAAFLRAAARRGVTGVHDFEGVDAWRLLLGLRDRGRLPLRVRFGFFLGALGDLGGRLGDLPPVDEVTRQGDERLRAFALKGVLDGALNSETAHLLEPYEGRLDRGLATLSPADLAAQGEEARRRGLTLALHAIGDAANRAALDAFAAWPPAARQRLRPRIEHAQLVADADVPRFAELGVVASMQPAHWIADRERALVLWGARAERGGYAWRRLAEAGARLAFGSDAPVEPLDPRAGLAAAVSGGEPGAPERAIGLDAAFAAYTTGAAWAARSEDRVGRIAPGLAADFVVWDDDPWAAAPGALARLSVGATCVAGEPVV